MVEIILGLNRGTWIITGHPLTFGQQRAVASDGDNTGEKKDKGDEFTIRKKQRIILTIEVCHGRARN